MTVAVVAATLAGGGTARAAMSGTELPPAVIERLDAEVVAGDRRLAEARRVLGRAVSRHRRSQIDVSELDARARLFEPLSEVAAWYGGDAARAVGVVVHGPVRDAERRLDLASAELEEVRVLAAEAQGASLDAHRRRDALLRAIDQQDAVDPDIGSYRFGSGGPSVSAASIDEYLAAHASPMTGQGAAFLEAGIEHDVDPRMLVAVAGAESYFGLQTCAAHNAWGWGCPSGPFRFRSWAEGIDTVARGLRSGYLDDGLTTVGEIHLRYAPPGATNDPTGLNHAWPDNVARFLAEQGGDPQDVTGLLRPGA